MRPGLELRREPRFERSYRRNVGDVYHYALGVLSDPLDAEEVTHTTFRNARHHWNGDGEGDPDLNSLLAIAHEVCRIRGAHDRLAEDELAAETPASPCDAAELAICREADGRLSRRARRGLRRHLADCDGCRAFAELQRAQRTAIGVLAETPLPPSLAPKPCARRPRLRLVALAGTAMLVLALAASGGIPGPASFIGQEQGPEADARIVDKSPSASFIGERRLPE